jgi:hypothetical protein
MALTVSALAQTAGLSADTVRYYERVGLLQVADQGQCPCGHTETLLRGRLAEVRAELERLRALEADLTRLLEQPPDPPCPEATTAAVTWWCAEDVADRRPPSGKEVNAMPLPDCPCDDCPPGCCQSG